MANVIYTVWENNSSGCATLSISIYCKNFYILFPIIEILIVIAYVSILFLHCLVLLLNKIKDYLFMENDCFGFP